MRFTTAPLRQVIANPRNFVAAARRPRPDAPPFNNPQRQWMEAAWRAFFAAGRVPEVLLETFNQKSTANPNPGRASLAAGALPMLDQFLVWDAEEPTAPADIAPPVRDVSLGAHILAVKRDLIYLAADGYLVRQIWTSRDLPADHVDASLMAYAVLICSDFDLGVERTSAIEVWDLRNGVRRRWRRDELAREAARLLDRLDEVAAALT